MRKRWVALGLVALALAAPMVRAQVEDSVYVAGALGRTGYGFDCRWTSCVGSHATAAKGQVGWRHGSWSIEAIVIDFGRASTQASVATRPGETLKLQAAGASLTGYGDWGPRLQGFGRVGWVQVRLDRTGEGRATDSAVLLGGGLLWSLTPALALEVAVDATSADGRDSGSVVGAAFTVGLRARF